MKHLSVTEFERIPRKRLGSGLCTRLQHFDERFARSSGTTAFDWSRIGYVRARNWVGVVQIPGLQIEILPKTDAEQGQARRNLLLMMSVCRRLPIRERDIATLLLEKRPILEALIAVFSGRLLNELRRGLDQEYVRREENTGFVRGKIVLPVHLRRNLAHSERVYVAYDEFLADTPVNHILKRTCRVLLKQTGNRTTQRELREAILVMANVTDREITRENFLRLRLNRQNERFRDLLDFCRLVLFDGTPAPRGGETPTFSLLVPMNDLFEEFVARLIRRHAHELGFERSRVHIQAKRMRRDLLRDEQGRGRYKLKPDVLISDSSNRTARILDTKWKALDGDRATKPSEADVYQLHAYARRYDCPENVLLFPKTAGAQREVLTLEGGELGTRVRVEFLDISRDIHCDRIGLLRELRLALHG